jgi:hypothetical protein
MTTNAKTNAKTTLKTEIQNRIKGPIPTAEWTFRRLCSSSMVRLSQLRFLDGHQSIVGKHQDELRGIFNTKEFKRMKNTVHPINSLVLAQRMAFVGESILTNGMCSPISVGIVGTSREMYVVAGRHRCTLLYYLFGDITVPCQFIYFEDEEDARNWASEENESSRKKQELEKASRTLTKKTEERVAPSFSDLISRDKVSVIIGLIGACNLTDWDGMEEFVFDIKSVDDPALKGFPVRTIAIALAKMVVLTNPPTYGKEDIYKNMLNTGIKMLNAYYRASFEIVSLAKSARSNTKSRQGSLNDFLERINLKGCRENDAFFTSKLLSSVASVAYRLIFEADESGREIDAAHRAKNFRGIVPSDKRIETVGRELAFAVADMATQTSLSSNKTSELTGYIARRVARAKSEKTWVSEVSGKCDAKSPASDWRKCQRKNRFYDVWWADFDSDEFALWGFGRGQEHGHGKPDNMVV